MEYRTLQHTDLTVSRVCFGTMTFGSQVEEPAAMKIMDWCLDQGINFFDTANVYNHGLSERIVGKGLKGRRDRVILASKVRGAMGDAPDQKGLSRKSIVRAIDESLERLGTDYLDVYYMHQPDYEAPIEETLEAMDELVRAGKVRYPAASNYAAWQMVEMQWKSDRNGYQPVRITQPMYNLIARGIEQEYIPMARKYGCSLIVYNPLAGGLLTGKHVQAGPVPGSRFDGNTMYLDRYWNPEAHAAVERLRSVANSAGRSLISLSLNWLLHHTATDCVILGASGLDQLAGNAAALQDGALPEDVVKACDDVWIQFRGPVPKYNR